MKQELFVQRYKPEWDAFEHWLDVRGESAAKARESRRQWHGLADTDIPARYRRLCQQLALARRRGYSPVLVERLQQLMQRGHTLLYRTPAPHWYRLVMFLLAGFPRLVREERLCMTVSALLFYLPALIIFVATQIKPELASALFDAPTLHRFEAMYDPHDASHALGRASETDLAMFGYYIWNNISIGFKTFASGLVAGIGAVIVLLTNGVMLGGVAGHLQAIGYGDPFWRFVAGHSALELTAIVIAGGAGLRLGLNLMAPGQRRRMDALVDGGRRGALLCAGVFVMLVMAAFIEAFWSSIGWMPAWIKYSVSAVLWSSVGVWLWRGGRNEALLDSAGEGPSP